ncbi:hypothetical protein OIU76_019117 [Salix suchowensis]|uniref:PROTEIN FATTY ACID EXPORT 5-RELATED n=2 Tax=Salix TaxID=40685 RepID=A0A9Q1AM75_9ROSI|nr:transmembrane protein [Salix suchowensis]KAJ6297935.1 hypothetical protein OIU76_019117 [Salix suchowensis]KAJ6314054.1 hypothetical protein OIU78_017667 [Salix suchowensis]KAJ6423221.1 hypothetical protein OIU84_024205 [Salix udensis]KAJ6776489.1 PROTEIN FATTY ACID EXPORT 5-RELATED [Salix koriyanagi]
MHDFCFTIPYGLALVIGGVIGYLKKGSMASLGGGAGTGLVLIIAGYLSLKAFEKRKNSFLGLAIETVCAAILTFVMGQRYIQTSKMMPAGIVAGISALMTLFYLYKIATGGNHIPAKAE